jgi:hypothetical protein
MQKGSSVLGGLAGDHYSPEESEVTFADNR